MLVISGRSQRLPDGSSVGYKVLHGGRGFRIPMLEEVNRMDMRLIPVQVEVQNAYSKGGIPLTGPRHREREGGQRSGSSIRNAIERLLIDDAAADRRRSRSRRSRACCARSSPSSPRKR